MALNSQSFSLPFHLTAPVEGALEAWRSEAKLRRLWERDSALWTGSDEADWLGWLNAPREVDRTCYRALTLESQSAGFSDVLLLGMGGSVLCPALFSQAFGCRPSFPKLTTLDSIDPASVLAAERSVDLERSLVVVSSKSGTTLESRILMAHFLDRMRRLLPDGEVSRHFMAVTDPGSELERSAREMGFRWTFRGQADIGGRFSAFSVFGLVPLALMGTDVGGFLDRTLPMVEACGPQANVAASPGVLLGVILGVLARHGRDKLTLVVSPSISQLGAWLEQLVAESTGKEGLGLIPITGEPLSASEAYGDDRIFVYLKLAGEADEASDASVSALEESGQPVVRIDIQDRLAIGQELFRWEIATAVVGSELGLNPFNQPDVEASKRVTRELMAEYERTGELPESTRWVEDRGLRLSGSGLAFTQDPGVSGTLGECVQDFLDTFRSRDYCAILVYGPQTARTRDALEQLRTAFARTAKVPTTLSFGPRYLHSSGQLHKGGPARGGFLILASEDSEDIPVPDHGYSFGLVKAAQARGDAQVLAARGRRVLLVEVHGPFEAGIERIRDVASALRPEVSG